MQMKPTDFAMHLTKFLSEYLPGHKNVSRHTISSYRDTFKLLIRYCEEKEGIAAEHITMNTLSGGLITRFFEWLETERKCSISTRSQRLAVIHSFFRYAQCEDPSGLYHFQKVIAIPVKKAGKAVVEHLTPEAMQFLLSQPDKTPLHGRRDLILMSVLYDTGARVQELIDIKVCDVILNTPAIIVLTGKGSKIRRVPVMKGAIQLLERYIHENCLDVNWKNEYLLFFSKQHRKLTKEGVSHIISKYVEKARLSSILIPSKVRPHMFRHSKAMHLLQAGINPIYIRDFLGHSDLETTEVYARADTETKRQAIENAYPELINSSLPDWNEDQALIAWLSRL